jgi:hypothetical protein
MRTAGSYGAGGVLNSGAGVDLQPTAGSAVTVNLGMNSNTTSFIFSFKYMNRYVQSSPRYVLTLDAFAESDEYVRVSYSTSTNNIVAYISHPNIGTYREAPDAFDGSSQGVHSIEINTNGFIYNNAFVDTGGSAAAPFAFAPGNYRFGIGSPSGVADAIVYAFVYNDVGFTESQRDDFHNYSVSLFS